MEEEKRYRLVGKRYRLAGKRANEEDSDENDEETKESKRIMLECGTCYFKSYDCKMCTHCKKVAYCDQFCQKLDWSWHKKQVYESNEKIDN